MAMYRAKEAGRNTYRFFDEAMNDEAVEHLLMRNGLRRALERGEFVLHYQPQIDLAQRPRSSASRRCCAGSTRNSAWCRRPASSRWPRTAA